MWSCEPPINLFSSFLLPFPIVRGFVAKDNYYETAVSVVVSLAIWSCDMVSGHVSLLFLNSLFLHTT